MMNRTFIRKPSRYRSLARKLLCAALLLAGTAVQTEAQSWQYVDPSAGAGANNTASQYPTPFGNDRPGQRARYVYTKAELDAAGLTAGWIDSLAFKVNDVHGSYLHTSLKFYVDVRSNVTVPPSGNFAPTSDLTLRYYDPVFAHLPALGWNAFGFSTPYYWNGTDDIVVHTCFWSGINSDNAGVEWSNISAVTGASSATFVPTSTATTGIAVCDELTPTKTAPVDTNWRPNIRFHNRNDDCTDKPEAGMAQYTTLYPPEFCIYDDSLELFLRGNTLAKGLSFQWQNSLGSDGPWSNYGAASTTSVGRKGYQTEGTYYRCVVTCTASGLTDTSTVIFIPQAAPYRCDCVSASVDGTKEKILNVTLADLFNATPCTGAPQTYNDYTGVPGLQANLEPGTEYTLRVRVGSCDPANRARAVKVFIDFDKNGQYDIGEMIYANTYSAAQPNPQNAEGLFTVPLTAKKGLTGMRIVYGEASSLSDIKPCGSYPAGETQDYRVNILNFGKPTVTGRLTVCEHDSVVMNAFSTADTPQVFNWTGPGGFTAIGPKITFVDADPSLSGMYYVTVTAEGRTSSPREVEVVVNPKPAPPNVLNANMCQYEPDGTLITDGENVLWYNVPVGGYGDTSAPKVPTHTPNVTTFYLTQTVKGCVSDRRKVDVSVLLKPSPPAVKSPVTYCQLQTPELVATGKNLRWYLDSAGGVPSTISPIPPTGFPDTLDYYVSQTINGCESDRMRVRVIVYEQPNGEIYHRRPYVCQYDTASFFYFGSAPATHEYKWFTVDGEYVSGGGQGDVVYRFNTPGDKVVNLYVNNGKCATSKISDTISVRPAPMALIDTVLNACVDVPVFISIDTATPYIEKWDWNWDGGQLTSETENGGPYGVVWSTPGTKTLRLMVTHRTCPSIETSQRIYVHDKPFAKIYRWDKIINGGKDTVAITDRVCSRDTIIFTAYKDTTYKYKWYPEYYFDVDTENVVVDRISNSAYIRVYVENDFGCKSADSILFSVEPCCDITFPNAFTPNNDNRNDVFRPIRDGRQDIVTFRIVNRWGQTVYESATTDQRGWDGTFAGRPLDMGVYQYYIKYKCIDGNYYEKKGDVTLIR